MALNKTEHISGRLPLIIYLNFTLFIEWENIFYLRFTLFREWENMNKTCVYYFIEYKCILRLLKRLLLNNIFIKGGVVYTWYWNV